VETEWEKVFLCFMITKSFWLLGPQKTGNCNCAHSSTREKHNLNSLSFQGYSNFHFVWITVNGPRCWIGTTKKNKMSARETGKDSSCIPRVKLAFFTFTFQYGIHILLLV